MRLIALACLAGMALPAYAQATSGAQIFSAREIAKDIASNQPASGSATVVLGDYGTHALKISVVRTSGRAEVHAHFDDVIVVEKGRATLVTGGALTDTRIKGPGETTGSGIQGGNSRPILTGDVVHIPAGTPHQLLIPRGSSFAALVVKVKE